MTREEKFKLVVNKFNIIDSNVQSQNKIGITSGTINKNYNLILNRFSCTNRESAFVGKVFA